jgi:hypothetical protein
MSVYLLHMMQPVNPEHPCRHYLGWAADVRPRIYAHLHGKGARLTEVAHERGIIMVWVRVWEDGDRTLERKLKNRKNAPALCPICQGLAVQMPLLRGEPAYVPTGEAVELKPVQESLDVDIAQFELFPSTSYFAHLYPEGRGR